MSEINRKKSIFEKGSVFVSGNTITLKGLNGSVIYELVSFEELPNINYTYKLVLKKNESTNSYFSDAFFSAGRPDENTTVQYKGVRCTKKSESFACADTFVTYTEPDENSKLFISNHLYMKSIDPYGDCNYKDSNCFRILPGLKIDSLAFITEKDRTWYLIDDPFLNIFKNDLDKEQYAWIFIPREVERDTSLQGSDYSADRPADEFNEQFIAAVKKYGIGKLSQLEVSRIKYRGGETFYYDYEGCVVWPALKSNGDSLTVNADKMTDANLKVRNQTDVNSSVVTIVARGTKVKITALGQQDVIDNRYSRWVQVQILPGAKDRSGNPIPDGTTGWCFGGYLQ